MTKLIVAKRQARQHVTTPRVRGDDAKGEAVSQDLASRITPLLPSYVPN